MRKLNSFLLGLVLIIVSLAVLLLAMEKKNSSSSKANSLVVYNWGDYIDPGLINKFQKETGISVQYETFDSNEAMYTKIEQGGTRYDIAIPSDYMIDKMRREDLLVKLDKSQIKGLDNLGSQFMGKSFDPKNDYSIPYFWGTIGIVYNDTMIKNPPQHWTDLWNSDYKDSIMLVDGAREVMGLGLNSLGYSLNSKNMSQLEQASDKLSQLTPNIKAIVGDEMKGYLKNSDAALGVTFSGEARDMLDANPHLHYVLPSEGSNLWFDNIVIPKTVKNKKAAYAFINFMLEPKNAAQNAEYIGYATPNKTAQKLLPKEITSDKAFYPSDQVISHLEVYNNLGAKWLGTYNDLYLQFKMYRH